MFPRFVISQRYGNEVVGSVSTTKIGGETWIRDSWLGYLFREPRFVYGRWHRRGEEWGFVPDEGEALPVADEWEVLDFYWGQRAELVLDIERQWTESIHDADDHDHCAICTATVGADGQRQGVVDADDTWVCTSCYESYVKPRSLAFITPQPDNE